MRWATVSPSSCPVCSARGKPSFLNFQRTTNKGSSRRKDWPSLVPQIKITWACAQAVVGRDQTICRIMSSIFKIDHVVFIDSDEDGDKNVEYFHNTTMSWNWWKNLHFAIIWIPLWINSKAWQTQNNNDPGMDSSLETNCWHTWEHKYDLSRPPRPAVVEIVPVVVMYFLSNLRTFWVIQDIFCVFECWNKQ